MTGVAMWRAPQGPGWSHDVNLALIGKPYVPPMNDTRFSTVLPDVGFDLIPYVDHDVATRLLVCFMLVSFCVCLHSKKRWEMMSRFMLVDAILLFMRGFTVVATSMNNPYPPCYNCGHDSCPSSVWTSVWWTVSKFPFFDCGDLMFSGHTVHFLLMALLWNRFCSHKALKMIVWSYTIPGIFTLIACRMHYTNDVLIGFFLTLFVWHWYHLTLTYHSELRVNRARVAGDDQINAAVKKTNYSLLTRLILWAENMEKSDDFVAGKVAEEQQELIPVIAQHKKSNLRHHQYDNNDHSFHMSHHGYSQYSHQMTMDSNNSYYPETRNAELASVSSPFSTQYGENGNDTLLYPYLFPHSTQLPPFSSDNRDPIAQHQNVMMHNECATRMTHNMAPLTHIEHKSWPLYTIRAHPHDSPSS